MLRKLFDTLANMGVWIRLNDPRHEPVSEAGRAWGSTVNNFALSLFPLSRDTVSVLIKNQGPVDLTVQIPGWLAFYRVSIAASDGTPAPLRPYGAGVLQDPQNTAVQTRRFPAGQSLSTEIPIAVLYHLLAAQYALTVSCAVPGFPNSRLTSNELRIAR